MSKAGLDEMKSEYLVDGVLFGTVYWRRGKSN
jgi:hypothetical protein